MNTYVVPFCNEEGELWVDKYQAKSLSLVQDKIIAEYTNLWDLDYSGDWKEFTEQLSDMNVLVGIPEDIDNL